MNIKEYTVTQVMIYSWLFCFILGILIAWWVTRHDWDKSVLVNLFFGLIVSVFLWVVPALLVKIHSHQECSTAKILHIGGCNRDAQCAVMTNVGEMTTRYPVIGGTVQYNCKNEWDK